MEKVKAWAEKKHGEMMPLQKNVVYGPVSSRRFGRSLGINFLPLRQKICSFDCIYCQYGKSFPVDKAVFAQSTSIEKQISDAFQSPIQQNTRPDWIMISGNGEATLHPEFARLVTLLTDQRDRWLAGVRVGILSNSSTCHLPAVRESLARLDGRFMKLDAGNIDIYQAMNVPSIGSKSQWDDMIAGLSQLLNVTLQSLFVQGAVDNTGHKDLGDWIKALERIRPNHVQIYTVSRPTRLRDVKPLEKTKLIKIAALVKDKLGIPTTIYD